MNDIQTERKVREGPHTFKPFPEDMVCPICRTNDDGTSVLVAIAGTEIDGRAQALPTHLACAVIPMWNKTWKFGIVTPDKPF